MNVKTKLTTAVSAVLMAATGAAVAEVTLYDYTDATSSYQDAYVSGSFNAADNGAQSQASYNGKLAVDYERVLSSPSRNVTLGGDVSGAFSRGGSAGASSTNSYSGKAGATVDNYFRPGSKGAFWFGDANASVQNGDGITADKVASDATVGLGYGRVVVVTPMAKTIRLVEALQSRGVLTSTPAKSVYQDIAKIVDRESEYKSKYGLKRYNQHWIADIEKALVASGTVNGGLNAAGVLESQQVLLNELISPRKYGWLVRSGVGVVLSTADGADAGDPLFRVGAEYHKPLNNQTQFSNVADFNTIIRDEDDSYNFSNDMKLTKEITDKVDWVNGWTLKYADYGNNTDTTSNKLSSSFIYDLDNQLYFKVEGSATKVDSADLDTALTMGVSYRLR